MLQHLNKIHDTALTNEMFTFKNWNNTEKKLKTHRRVKPPVSYQSISDVLRCILDVFSAQNDILYGTCS